MCKICRVKVISCENGKILMITGAMDGCEVCIRLNRTACAFVIICCMCVTLCVCVCVCPLLGPGMLCSCSPTLMKMMNLGILCSERTDLTALSLVYTVAAYTCNMQNTTCILTIDPMWTHIAETARLHYHLMYVMGSARSLSSKVIVIQQDLA